MNIKERTLRGVLAPGEAARALGAIIVLLSGTASVGRILQQDAFLGPASGLVAPSQVMPRTGLVAFSDPAIAGIAAASLLTLLGGAACCGLLAVAGAVDAARRILPDPLVLSAGGIAASLAFATGRPERIGAAALFVIVGWLIGRAVPLGFGDAKLAGVLAALLGAAPAGLALGAGILGCGVATAHAVLTGRRAPTAAVALGPWLVAAGVAAWLACWL